MSTATAPLSIGRVALTVHDLTAMRDFYAQAIGLEPFEEAGGVATLGVGDAVLLELREDRAARRHRPEEAGLFHTAFLLPDRPALGRWLRHAAEDGLPIEGAADHLVSEAIYLTDPEGNGIEVYADKPREVWPRGADGLLRLANARLDLDALAREADAPWAGAPDGSVVGHVHLQVGDLHEAVAFYCGTLGFAVMAEYPGARFLGSGGYHHHLGVNVWQSRGAGPRRLPATGLAEVEVVVAVAHHSTSAPWVGDVALDPWGTPVRLSRRP